MRERIKQIIDYSKRAWIKLFVILIIFIIFYWTRYQTVQGGERAFYMINRLTGEITWVTGETRKKVLEEGWERKY